MFGRPRRRSRRREQPEGTLEAFLRTVEQVEGAKASLASSAPSGRTPGRPLAEALAGFEAGLAAARDGMATWRVSGMEGVWDRCREGLEEAARRAERLRLEATPQGYEQLYGLLGELMDPLDRFAVARDRLRQLGL